MKEFSVNVKCESADQLTMALGLVMAELDADPKTIDAMEVDAVLVPSESTAWGPIEVQLMRVE